jgi:hypothetical protein
MGMPANSSQAPQNVQQWHAHAAMIDVPFGAQGMLGCRGIQGSVFIPDAKT